MYILDLRVMLAIAGFAAARRRPAERRTGSQREATSPVGQEDLLRC